MTYAAHRRRITGYLMILCVSLTWTVFSGDAAAERKVFLNGIDITDVEVPKRTFSRCKVRFDEKGNIHITVKGYKIGKKKKPKKSNEQDEPLGNTHFLVVRPVRANGEVYRVTVSVNGALVQEVMGTPKMQVYDITPMMNRGKNRVRLVADERASTESELLPSDDLEIVVGRGRVDKGKRAVVIQVPYVEYRRRTSDTMSYDNTYRFTVK